LGETAGYEAAQVSVARGTVVLCVAQFQCAKVANGGGYKCKYESCKIKIRDRVPRYIIMPRNEYAYIYIYVYIYIECTCIKMRILIVSSAVPYDRNIRYRNLGQHLHVY